MNIFLALKSASAYKGLLDSKVLVLTSRRALTDYKNATRPTAEFNPKVAQELITASTGLVDYQRSVVVSFNEMKIQGNSVFDKYSGELIGFVNLETSDLNYTTFDKRGTLASRMIVFYVRGLASNLKLNFS